MDIKCSFKVIKHPRVEMETFFWTGSKDRGRFFDDSMLGPDLGKITKIRLWYDEYVDGIEVYYGSRTNGQQIGQCRTHNHKVGELILDDDEYVIEVSGRSGDWMDALSFKTNKGRALKAELGTGGNAFSFDAPGKVVAYFKYEVNNHIEGFGAGFVEPTDKKMLGPVKEKVLKTVVCGNTKVADKTSMAFDDYKDYLAPLIKSGYSSEIAEITIMADSNYVVGIECVYKLTDEKGTHKEKTVYKKLTHALSKEKSTIEKTLKLEGKNKIISVRGRIDKYITHLEVTSLNGSIEVGEGDGEEFDLNVPLGKRVVSFGGSVEQYVCGLFAYYS